MKKIVVGVEQAARLHPDNVMVTALCGVFRYIIMITIITTYHYDHNYHYHYDHHYHYQGRGHIHHPAPGTRSGRAPDLLLIILLIILVILDILQ